MLEALIDRAIQMMHSSAGRVRVDDNPAVSLGAVLGALYRAGRDKLTFIISPPIAAFGLWVEQLIAESTGKNGIGIVPICDEPLVDAKSYADDRVFVYLKLTERRRCGAGCGVRSDQASWYPDGADHSG